MSLDAFSDNEKYDILYYLGWPLQTIEEDSTYFRNTVKTRLDGASPGVIRVVRRILARLQDINQSERDISKAMLVSSVGDVKISDKARDEIERERLRTVRDLSAALDLPIVGRSSGGISVVV